MSENNDQYLSILLDIQKQLGDVKSETRGQSEMLVALNEKVAIQNGRVVKLEIADIKIEAIINNWKGRLVILASIVSVIVGLLSSWFRNKLGL